MTGDDRTGNRPKQLATVDAGAELTASTAAELRAIVTAAVTAHSVTEKSVTENAVLRVLLGDVTKFDLTGLRLLVGLHRQARSAGVCLVYVHPQSVLFVAMRRHGMHRILTIDLDARPYNRPRISGRPQGGDRAT